MCVPVFPLIRMPKIPLICLLTFCLWGGLLRAEESKESLTFGMSTALSGPAAGLGQNMKLGFEAAFGEINREQGIEGRPLHLIALDDGYEPIRTTPNMRKLIDKQEVLAIVGNVGTPTAVAAIPIAQEAKTPFFGAFTGAGVLRKTPPDRYVINYRASYAEETAAMVDALIDIAKMKTDEIAFFTQRDAYGDAGYAGGITALKRHGLKNEQSIAHGRYERNTLAIENALADIAQSNPLPKAIIMVGSYAPCAAFIKQAKEFGLHSLFLNVSFVGTAPLAKELGDLSDGVIVTQVVPHPESDLPIVREYREAITRANPSAEYTFGSLEGYIAARILIKAIRSYSEEITREGIIKALEGLGEFDIGLKEPLKLGPGIHQASHAIWPTIIRKGKAIPFEWTDLSPK